MKDIEKIIADLQAWVEEDKENRAMTGLIKIADRLLKKSDKKSENGSEEGKEADHE